MVRIALRLPIFFALALLVCRMGAAQGNPDLSGRWRLDRDRSDDPERTILAGLGDPNRMRPEDRRTAERLIQLAGALDELEIRQSDKDFRLYDQSNNVRIYYIDGKKHVRQTPWGEKLQTETSWEGGALHMKTDGKELGQVDETYGLEGRQMVFIVRVRLKGQKEDVVVKSYYHRVTE